MENIQVVLVEYFINKRLEKYSLGLGYINNYLLVNNVPSNLLIFENESAEEVSQKILVYRPNVVGIKLYAENADLVFMIARLLKTVQPATKIVLGGHIASLYGAKILASVSSIDYIVAGEGEASMLELCERLRDQKDLEGCKGIFYRVGEFTFKNQPRELINEIDTLPFPYFEPKVADDSKSPYVMAAVSTSRGCIGKCNYCVIKKIFNKQPHISEWRGRSPEKVIKEIQSIQNRFAGKNLIIRFVDGAFEDPDPVKKGRIDDLMTLMDEKHIEIAFSFNTRAESWSEKDASLILKMKKMGLYTISLGFNESIKLIPAKSMTQKVFSNQQLQTYQIFKQYQVPVFSYLILFQPFIRLEDLYTCASFIEKVDMAYHPDSWIHDLVLFPDTYLFHEVVENGLLIDIDSNGYSYRYGFEDGRVGKVHQKIKELEAKQSINDLPNTISKINLELELYWSWKDRKSELMNVQRELETYQNTISEIYLAMGNQQKALFTELLDQKNELAQNSILKDWDRKAQDFQSRLEKEWMICRFKTGRKKVNLL